MKMACLRIRVRMRSVVGQVLLALGENMKVMLAILGCGLGLNALWLRILVSLLSTCWWNVCVCCDL
jgi:hypothetical protein